MREFNTRERGLAGMCDALLAWTWSMVLILLILKLLLRTFMEAV